LQTERLAKSFDGLNSSLAQPTGEIWSFKVAQKFGLNVGFPSTILHSLYCKEKISGL